MEKEAAILYMVTKRGAQKQTPNQSGEATPFDLKPHYPDKYGGNVE